MKKCNLCKEEKTKTDFYFRNKEKGSLYSRCKVCHLQKTKENVEKNKDKVSERQKRWRGNNQEKIKAYWKIYYPTYKGSERREKAIKKFNNSDKRRKYCREWNKKQWKENPLFRLNGNVSTLVYLSLRDKKSSRSWEGLVGYTLEALKKHIENQFEDWMTWDNYGKWHIDHIKPRSSFNFKEPEDPEFKKCWALENLQPLEAIENIRKGNKLI